NLVAFNHIVVTTMSSVREDYMDAPIDPYAPTGTYSCATFIAESFDGTTISGIWDMKVDPNVLTITPGLGAVIISTSFSSA
ncbi:unnamed protein product, partial [marine sediment metagenome]